MNAILRVLDQGNVVSLFFSVVLLHLVGERIAEPEHRRLARGPCLIAFFAYGGSAWVRRTPETGQNMQDLVVRSLLAAGLAYELSTFAMPLVLAIFNRLVVGPRRAIRHWWAERGRRRRDSWEHRQAEQRRRRESEEAARDEPSRRAAEEKARSASLERDRIVADSRRRRENARSECLLYYHLHAPEISFRFPRNKYDEFAGHYLRDDVPAEEVERQAARLLALMESHLEKTGKARGKIDVAGYARWYSEEKAKIESQVVAQDIKDTHLVILEARYAELVEKHLEGLRP